MSNWVVVSHTQIFDLFTQIPRGWETTKYCKYSAGSLRLFYCCVAGFVLTGQKHAHWLIAVKVYTTADGWNIITPHQNILIIIIIIIIIITIIITINNKWWLRCFHHMCSPSCSPFLLEPPGTQSMKQLFHGQEQLGLFMVITPHIPSQKGLDKGIIGWARWFSLKQWVDLRTHEFHVRVTSDKSWLLTNDRFSMVMNFWWWNLQTFLEIGVNSREVSSNSSRLF